MPNPDPMPNPDLESQLNDMELEATKLQRDLALMTRRAQETEPLINSQPAAEPS